MGSEEGLGICLHISGFKMSPCSAILDCEK